MDYCVSSEAARGEIYMRGSITEAENENYDCKLGGGSSDNFDLTIVQISKKASHFVITCPHYLL